MATICAGRCLLSHIDSSPKQIFTYGSPRVGNKRYINHAKIDYLRWVNNNDIVTRVPPTWLGYRHTGEERYLNAYGKLRKLNPVQRSKDRWRGFMQGVRSGEFDHFSDHLIDRYVQYIYEESVRQGEISPELDLPEIKLEFGTAQRLCIQNLQICLVPQGDSGNDSEAHAVTFSAFVLGHAQRVLAWLRDLLEAIPLPLSSMVSRPIFLSRTGQAH